MVSKILKNIIQTITWPILLLSLCTAERRMLNDGWILWPCRPNVMHDPGSTPLPFFQFLPGLPPFLLCLPTAVCANYLNLAPYQFFSFYSWQLFLLAFSKILCAPLLYLLCFKIYVWIEIWSLRLLWRKQKGNLHCLCGRRCPCLLSMSREFSWVFFVTLSSIMQVLIE